MTSKDPSLSPAIVWFRRDLRLADNRALSAAIASKRPVLCLYIRDPKDPFAGALGAAQAWWLNHSLSRLDQSLRQRGNRLILMTGPADAVLDALIAETGAATVLWNRRYDPEGIATDRVIKDRLRARGLRCDSYSGFLMHEPSRLLTQQGQKYQVYTPFWRAFERSYQPQDPLPAPDTIRPPERSPDGDMLADWRLLPDSPDWATGFSQVWSPGEAGAEDKLTLFIDNALAGYKAQRDRPDGRTSSLLSPHLAMGEISPHRLWRATEGLGDDIASEDIVHFRKEVVWREFSWHLMFHLPDLAGSNINRTFDGFPWQFDQDLLTRWQKGMTGYPIVDAGMRQLWRHGWMHNRVRMVAASFLIKHLLIDWRHGERWFRDTLVDADRASNAASWQWVAGSGADAAPYFRIFNPTKQGETFDGDGAYVRAFCPELAALPDRHIHRPFEASANVLEKAGIVLGRDYPLAAIAHDQARARALSAYGAMKAGES